MFVWHMSATRDLKGYQALRNFLRRNIMPDADFDGKSHQLSIQEKLLMRASYTVKSQKKRWGGYLNNFKYIQLLASHSRLTIYRGRNLYKNALRIFVACR